MNYRQFKHFERADILSQPWDILKGFVDPNEMLLKWKALFLGVCDAHAPLNYRDHLKKKAVKSSNPIDWNHYRSKQ